MKIKCLNMFLVISTASEDITDRNSYLCTTRLILLLCISLWRYLLNLNTADAHHLVVKGPKEIKPKS